MTLLTFSDLQELSDFLLSRSAAAARQQAQGQEPKRGKMEFWLRQTALRAEAQTWATAAEIVKGAKVSPPKDLPTQDHSALKGRLR